MSLPSAEEFFLMKLPHVESNVPSDHFYKCVLANLPRRHAGHLYESNQIDSDLLVYLEDAAYAPALRIIAIIALLEKMSTDSKFEERDRRHVDTAKTKLFWRIIGQEVDITEKDSNGGTFSSAFIKPLVPQTAHILDCCHIYSYTKALPPNLQQVLSQTTLEPSENAKLEHLFGELRAQIADSVYVAQLEEQLLNSPNGFNELRDLMYAHFIKLGIVERAIYAGKARAIEAYNLDELEKMRNTKPVDEWVDKSYDYFTQRSKDCIKAVCDTLALKTAGSLDDTTRAQIRAIPQRMTNAVGGIKFLDGYIITWQGQLANSGLDPNPFPMLTPAITPEMVRARNGGDFIREYGRSMQCWKDFPDEGSKCVIL